MDIYKAIRDLQDEKKRIDRMIASLEHMLKAGSTHRKPSRGTPGRRGRKSMSEEERKAVSERMRKYWAAHRAAAAGADGGSNGGSDPEPDTPGDEAPSV